MRAAASISFVGLALATLAVAAPATAAEPAPAPPAATAPSARSTTASSTTPAPGAPPRPTVAAATTTAPASSRPATTTAPASSRPATASPASTAAPRTVAATSPSSSAVREPAPRPVTDVRVQSRFATKLKNTQLFAGAEYLSRGDYYNSPGARVGATYYPFESLGLELQVSHYWSSLNDSAERVKEQAGYIPDSHAPAWLMLAGGRYSLGYGKLMVGGMGSAIHFEPQGFLHAGLHVHDGDIGPSGDFGLGLLVFLTPTIFTRIDVAIVYERETRSGVPVGVWGTLPALAIGATL